MPIGQRKPGRINNNTKSEEDESLFDEEAWKDWKPKSYEKSIADFNRDLQGGINDLQELVQDFNGSVGDEDSLETERFKGELSSLIENLSAKTEGEDRKMKEVSKSMSEKEGEDVEIKKNP